MNNSQQNQSTYCHFSLKFLTYSSGMPHGHYSSLLHSPVPSLKRHCLLPAVLPCHACMPQLTSFFPFHMAIQPSCQCSRQAIHACPHSVDFQCSARGQVLRYTVNPSHALCDDPVVQSMILKMLSPSLLPSDISLIFCSSTQTPDADFMPAQRRPSSFLFLSFSFLPAFCLSAVASLCRPVIWMSRSI